MFHMKSLETQQPPTTHDHEIRILNTAVLRVRPKRSDIPGCTAVTRNTSPSIILDDTLGRVVVNTLGDEPLLRAQHRPLHRVHRFVRR